MVVNLHSIVSHKYINLMSAYVQVCNQAININQGRFPFKQIWNFLKSTNADMSVAVIIDDKEIQETYCLSVGKNGIGVDTSVKFDHVPPTKKWKADLDYLLCVANKPDIYIENPAKLNWEWLYPEKKKTI